MCEKWQEWGKQENIRKGEKRKFGKDKNKVIVVIVKRPWYIRS